MDMKKTPREFIKKTAAVFFLSLICLIFSAIFNVLQAQNRTGKVMGMLTDAETNEVLIGATLTIKPLNRSYQTNVAGEFNIDIPEGSYQLSFNYIGFESKTLSILVSERDTTKLEVKLKTASNQLGEVVIVGYGTQRKRDLTGAIANVTSEQLEKRYSNNTLGALSGLTPGVSILNNSGSPEGDYKVIIRGLGSITASNDPLYVIDGIIDADPQLINPFDIASINVLKDASATSIYGTRGSNGVIIINTKQGGSKF